MLVIYRQPLADAGAKTEVARYSDITLSTGNSFIDQAAQKEADGRDDCKHVSLKISPETEEGYETCIRHSATLVGHRGELLVEYYGLWPMDDEPSEDESRQEG